MLFIFKTISFAITSLHAVSSCYRCYIINKPNITLLYRLNKTLTDKVEGVITFNIFIFTFCKDSPLTIHIFKTYLFRFILIFLF